MNKHAGIKIHGLEELQIKARGIKEDVIPTLEKATIEAQHYVHGRVPEYPDQLVSSKYQRTGTLGREITTPDKPKRIGREIVGSIGTVTQYAPWVIGHKKLKDGRGPQAWMHQNVWWTLMQVVEDARDGIVKIYQNAIHELRKKWK